MVHHLHRRDLALGEGVPRARSVAHQVDQHVHALIVDDARRLVWVRARATARPRARVGNGVWVRVSGRLGVGYMGDIWEI